MDSMSRASVREAASPKAEVLKRFISQRSAVAGAAFLTLLILLALIGPYISGHRFDDQNLGHTNLAPRVPVLSSLGILDGSEKMFKTGGTEVVNRYEEQGITDVYYLFGTDSLGRDMFARTFMGLRISLLIAFIATTINLIIGMNYGIISGYFGEMTDILMQRTIDVIGSIPTLVVVTLLMIVLKPGIGSIIFALMLSGWIEMSRIARAEVLKVKELEYIQAAKPSEQATCTSYFVRWSRISRASWSHRSCSASPKPSFSKPSSASWDWECLPAHVLLEPS